MSRHEDEVEFGAVLTHTRAHTLATVAAVSLLLTVNACSMRDGDRQALMPPPPRSEMRLTLNPDHTVTVREVGGGEDGRVLMERVQSLDDPISTLWDR